MDISRPAYTEWSSNNVLDWNDGHSFLVRYSRFEQSGNLWLCTLDGEYFFRGRAYEPPRRYTMSGVPVLSTIFSEIIPHPIYPDPFGELERLLKRDC